MHARSAATTSAATHFRTNRSERRFNVELTPTPRRVPSTSRFIPCRGLQMPDYVSPGQSGILFEQQGNGPGHMRRRHAGAGEVATFRCCAGVQTTAGVGTARTTVAAKVGHIIFG